MSVVQARDAFAVGDLPAAAETLQEIVEGPKKNRAVGELDLAIVELAMGKPKSAERRLRQARDRFDAVSQSAWSAGSLSTNVLSYATDDNARRFELTGYEQVMVRTLLAMCSLAHDRIDAEAYCLQAQAKQAELAQQAEQAGRPTEPYMPIAVAPYLRGVLREATHQNYDDAERAFRLVSTIRPDFLPAGSDIQRAVTGNHSQPGHGVLYVIAMTGRGPQLIEQTADTTTASLQIASTVLRQMDNHQKGDDGEPVLPNIAAVKVPVVQVPPTPIAAVGVDYQGHLLGATQTLTDLADLAHRQSEAEMPWTIARAVVRRAVKETSVRATSKQLGLEGNAAAAFEFAAINAWCATEKADTRCWGLLPREIQVLRAELPQGSNEVALSSMGHDGQIIGAQVTRDIVIEDGRNHYLVVIAPEQIVSTIISNP